MRTLRARVVFPAEVHVERLAIPSHLERMHATMRAAGLDPARYSVTGRDTQHTPPIQWPGPWRGPRPDLVVIDDPIKLRPAQRQSRDEALKWWGEIMAVRK